MHFYHRLILLSTASFAIMNWPYAQSIPPSPDIVLLHVNIIDIYSGKIKKNRTVEISSGMLMSIQKHKRKNYVVNVSLIEAKGKYLIPGLWDMHVHITTGVWDRPKNTFALMIANGITGVRDMGGDLLHIKTLKGLIANGSLIGPRIIAAGPFLYGPRNIGSTYLAVPSSAHARRIVDSLKEAGVDFVKVYNFIDREQYFAIADESKKLKLPFAGHVPWSISIIEAANAGQSSIEHLNFPFFAEECAMESSRFRQMDLAKIDRFSRPFDKASVPAFMEQLHYLDSALLQFKQKKADTIYNYLASNHTWQCPTLVYLKTSTHFRDSNLQKDKLMKYAYSPRIQNEWNYKNIPLTAAMKDREYNILQRLYEKNLQIVNDMKKRGIPFLAGTDLTNAFIYPGFSLHQELQMFVQTGFTSLQALQTATINPARFLGLEDSLGSIQEGKYADVILLNANPLKEIMNTQAIEAVILKGKYYDRKQLNELLKSADH